MGREIKRVPLTFDAPLDKTWEGYAPPEKGTKPCPVCPGRDGRPTGYSRLGNAIYAMSDYDRDPRILPETSDKLTSDEIRFLSALEKSVAPQHRKGRADRHPYTYGGLSNLTDQRMAAYDLMRHLAKSLKVSFKKTFFCPACKGECEVVDNYEVNGKAKRWRRREPPKGKGWQVWETVSEGSPITPVFATPEELIEYICTVGTTWDRKSIAEGWKTSLPTRAQATAFVKGTGWVPSAVITVGEDGSTTMHKNIEAASVMLGASQ